LRWSARRRSWVGDDVAMLEVSDATDSCTVMGSYGRKPESRRW
jgi:hypothetical protein